jgi:hypothetical protein
MKRPTGKAPFFVDEQGNEGPLFVPPAMLAEARAAAPGTWIEPTPMLPLDPPADPAKSRPR